MGLLDNYSYSLAPSVPVPLISMANYGLPKTDFSLSPNVNANPIGLRLPGTEVLGLPNGLIGGQGSAQEKPFWQKLIGTKDEPGPGGLMLGAANFAGNMFMGMKQYGIAKKQLAESKRQFDLNYDAQKKMTNSMLEDRQRGRNLTSAGQHMSPEEYLSRYGVK